ncbi:ribosome biogenesis regulatory protein homolog [Coccinella septempunctata]|uniref:ribosome biogenesis regulatory protein homolog n=1 Tax=Coccinella septempunctata TaxID=41139 RepID=UPI001D0835D4|nr:ribosome biogenesis regulatory protein homolog [Coccinella septempunctata]
MVVLKEILKQSEQESLKYKSIDVQKHLEVQLDVGSLLAADPNVLDEQSLKRNKDSYLLDLTRDNVQLLFNKVWDLPTERVEEAIVAKLPPAKYILPRSKPCPKPRALTKWEQFARDKGIQKKKKSKLTWDDQLKKWVPRFGFKKVKADKEKDWVIEVPQNADPMEDQFEKKAMAKGERIAKNELQRLRNIAKAKNVKVPRFGVLDPEKSSSKDILAAITVAKASTASVGKFQDKLPREKEARGIATITPGASNRKRKLPPVSAEDEKALNLSIANSVLNKRPKLDIEKAVSKQIRTGPSNMEDDDDAAPGRKKSKGGKKSNAPKSTKGKKPKSTGQRKGKGGGKGTGRKRR